MALIDDLEPSDAARLVELVGRLKHDLGKYIALQQRWVLPTATEAERRAALSADLLSTRRGPTGQVDAVEVWRGFEQAFAIAEPDIHDDSDLSGIRREMVTVDAVVTALREGRTDAALEARGRAAALAVSEGCRRLWRRIRTQAEGSWPTSS
ncbi:MAG: hypothetical protein ACI8PZ_004760 [Myxococcota bacterium]|jgi:hypothetical protein